MVKVDLLDVDAMRRIRETDIWRDYEARIRERLKSQANSCMNAGLDERALRVAQGNVEALQFVLGLPDQIHKEIVRKSGKESKDAG